MSKRAKQAGKYAAALRMMSDEIVARDLVDAESQAMGLVVFFDEVWPHPIEDFVRLWKDKRKKTANA